jgi:hypothetical protein
MKRSPRCIRLRSHRVTLLSPTAASSNESSTFALAAPPFDSQNCTFAEYLSHLSASNVREKPFSKAETGDRDIAICRANSNLRVSPFAYQLVNFRRRAATQLYRLGKIIDHFSIRRFCVDVK